ncbi:T6SS effector phospholipase Tle3 domain-containing protein [Chimaeribacter arupi]|uniref:T6SS effector phospholipase Tle3 domain-containing protein n=1 Tax=Chimaeribacter arupi TaxID=2060066 RepID=UPI000C7B9E54|nr:DUF3274 domain-containing protein [Chimaeribacter arupi]PLR31780.1 hypothetical protein CYR23_15480 [Chimaeribacter arupi]
MSDQPKAQDVNPFDDAPEPRDPQSNGVHTPHYLASRYIGVPVSAGKKSYTTDCPVQRPMPGIVILVHGVNDVGEAYQNQERGIIEGLKKRLGRDDLWPHTWEEKTFRVRNASGEMEECADPQKKQRVCSDIARSPIIPFYWGYRPVDYEVWDDDQRQYREAMGRSRRSPETPLPYDAYRENDKAVLRKFGAKYPMDCFHNTLDPSGVWGGGTFANATTAIPDMLGPGAGGLSLGVVGFLSRAELFNGGDFTHPVYKNPHRIYQFYAAQRLANLILTIRRNLPTKKDTINIVAHSQGTLITMLANMLVKAEGLEPADCVILNHSPYSLENRWLENSQTGHHQTDAARQQTFENFCRLMATNARFTEGGDGLLSEEDQQKLLETMALPRREFNNSWYSNPLHQRNNFGKVYNYFCPDDGTVSLLPVQGIGWRGVPQKMAKNIPNLKQRVFHQNSSVGLPPDGKPFRKPATGKGDFEYSSLTNARWEFSDVIPNGEALPEPFIFTLMGQLNPLDENADKDKAYRAPVDGNDELVAYNARAGAAGNAEHTKEETFPCPPYTPFKELQPGHLLTKREIDILKYWRERDIVSGKVVSVNGTNKNIVVRRRLTEAELHELYSKSDDVMFSQHSSIVMSPKVPELAMAYDLAIGPCKSFDVDHGHFWQRLLRLADWRDRWSEDEYALAYYRTGKLPEPKTKWYMNKPDLILPTGKFGVVNQFMNATRVIPARYPEIHNTEVANLQWPMPPVENYDRVPAYPKRKVT